MATPRVSDKPTTQRQYAGQLLLTAAMAQAIRELWAALTPTVSLDAMQSFRRGVHVIVPQYGRTASQQALTNYRIARRDAGVTTLVRPVRPTPVPASKIDASLDWAERALKDIGAEQSAALAEIEASILRQIEASMQKALMDEAREATIEAVEGDEKAIGYRRVPRPGACAWCLAMAIRKTSRRGLAKDFKRYGTQASLSGEEHWGVYKSRAAAGQTPVGSDEINRFHTNCHCVVEPIFSTDFNVPVWLHDVSDLYDDADDFNHFRRIIEARRRGAADPDSSPLPILPPTTGAQGQQVTALLATIDRLMAT